MAPVTPDAIHKVIQVGIFWEVTPQAAFIHLRGLPLASQAFSIASRLFSSSRVQKPFVVPSLERIVPILIRANLAQPQHSLEENDLARGASWVVPIKSGKS